MGSLELPLVLDTCHSSVPGPGTTQAGHIHQLHPNTDQLLKCTSQFNTQQVILPSCDSHLSIENQA